MCNPNVQPTPSGGEEILPNGQETTPLSAPFVSVLPAKVRETRPAFFQKPHPKGSGSK